MIDVLRALFATPEAPAQAPDAPLAVAALLCEAARADGAVDPAEATAIERFLAHAFDLGPWEAQALRAEGERAQSDAADVVRFTRVIKTGLDLETRREVMASLWRVALADGVRDPHEDALMRKLAPLLGLSDRDSAEARRRAGQPV